MRRNYIYPKNSMLTFQRFALFLLLLAGLNAKAQPPMPIRGLVIDSLYGAPLEEATITLEHLPDCLVIQRIRSSRNGFLFRRPPPGNYRILTTYLGYSPDTLNLVVSAIIPDKRLYIRMRHSSQPLMEVVVRASIPPAIVRNDTIAFNAEAFPMRPNATVEDLLRRLPGIQIDKNGNITLQGKKVDKIYLEGKEFFLGDLKTATQNLPADVVAQIETFDSRSEQSRLTGVRDNSNTKTLNIRLKKDRKKGIFGKLYIGAGNDSYAAGATVTSLSASRNLLANFNANNINNQFDGKEINNGPGSGGLQTLSRGDLNYRDAWGEKLSATFNLGGNSMHNNLVSSSTRQTFLSDSSLLESRQSRSTTSSEGYHANAAFEYKIDSLNTMLLHSNWNGQHSTNATQDTVAVSTKTPTHLFTGSAGVTNNGSHTDGFTLNNAIDFRHSFPKKGRSLYLGLTQSTQDQQAPSSLYSRVATFDSTGNFLGQAFTDQRSTQHNTADSYGSSLTYTEPLGPRHILDIGYMANTTTNHSDKQSFDYDSTTAKYDLPDTLTSNRFFSRSTTQRISAGYNATENKFRYQFGISAQFTDLFNDNQTTNSPLRQHFTNWYPRASLFYTMAKGKTLNFGYVGSSIAPTVDQLQPIPDLTNPFLVRLGNTALQQQFTHSLFTNYFSFNPHNFRNFQADLNADYTTDKISPSTSTLPGGIEQIQYINVQGTWHLNTNITYGFPIGNRKGNGSASLHGSYGHEPSILNGAENNTNSTGWGARANANYHPTEKLFLDANVATDYTAALYTQNKTQNTQTAQQNYGLECSYEFPGAITLSSAYNLQVTGAQTGLPAQSVSLWNAAIYKSIFSNHAGELRLSAFDLLDNSSNYTQTTGPDYLETRQTNLPGRLWLLSFIYHFRHFPSAK